MANVKTKQKKTFDFNNGQPMKWLLVDVLYKCEFIWRIKFYKPHEMEILFIEINSDIYSFVSKFICFDFYMMPLAMIKIMIRMIFSISLEYKR